MKKWALAIAWVVSLIVVAGLSASSALKNKLSEFRVELDATQAMLAFNHMGTYQELESDLARGFVPQYLIFAGLFRSRALSSFHRGGKSTV
jgi:hypothetical protein